MLKETPPDEGYPGDDARGERAMRRSERPNVLDTGRSELCGREPRKMLMIL